MYDLHELYQEVVLDHNRRPRNFKKLEDANRTGEGYNPLCGDRIALFLNVEDDVIREVGFQAAGCAISKASASMMTESIKGKTTQEAERIFEAFRRMVTRKPGLEFDADLLDDLEVLEGVSQYPSPYKMRDAVVAHTPIGAEWQT